MPSSKLRHPGRWWRISGICLVLLAFVLVTPLQSMQNDPDHMDWTTFLVLAPLAIACSIGGLSCFMRGRKMKAVSARTLVAQDQRPPVVYLRSFKDDAVAASNQLAGILGLGSFILGMSTEEEQLAEAFNEIGPFIAIGKPGEKLPEVGAARMYVGDAEWQERVAEWMAGAQLVVLRAGKTAGFWWEVKRAGEILPPTKILFLVPFGKKKYEEFRQRAQQLLPCRLPDFPKGHSTSLSALQVMIYFGPDWTPHVVRLKARFSLSLNPVAPILQQVLQPVARQLEVDTRGHAAPKRGLVGRFLKTIPGVLAAGIVCSVIAAFGISVLDAALNNRGLQEADSGDIKGAIRKYREAIRLNPESPNPHCNLGVALYKMNELDGAIAEYREALRLNPRLVEAQTSLGLALMHKGSLDEGIAACRKAIEIDSHNAVAHSNLGVGLLKRGDHAALGEFQRANELAPDNPTIRANLAVAVQQFAPAPASDAGK